MDKNTIIGLVLIVAVLIGYSYFNTPEQAPSATPAMTSGTAEGFDKGAAQEALVPDSTALFASYHAKAEPATVKASDVVVLKNDNVTVEISRRGGVPTNVYLTKYRSYEDFSKERQAPLHLYDGKTAAMNFAFDTKEETINTSEYVFDVAKKDSTEAILSMTAKDGSVLELHYKLLPGDNYMMNLSVATKGMARHFTSRTKTFGIDWKQKIAQQEKGYYFENQYSTLTYKLNGEGTEKLSAQSDDQETAEGSVDWIAYKNQYFSTVLIAPTAEFSDVKLNSRQIPEEATGADKGFLKDYAAEMNIGFDPSGKQATQFQFYFGPNSFNLLKSMDQYKAGDKDLDLEDLVYLGWPLFKWINRFFTIYVFDFFTSMGLPMGIVLLLITLLLRVIVYIPTKKSFLSSARMRVLKPKVDEINQKYPNKEDAMKKQQETMALYSQYGVSPMGGCLPMLIQAPIWIAMYNFVPNAIELRQQGFLWADDLSTYDSILDFGFSIWGIGDHLSLFCLLFCGTNLLYSVMTIRQQKETLSGEQAQQMKMMQWMMYLMPVMFFFIFNNYSSGLNYYYFISLLASALTMWYLRRSIDDKRILAKLEANYQANKNNPNRKPKGLAARLEALQKQQEAMLEEQKKRQQR